MAVVGKRSGRKNLPKVVSAPIRHVKDLHADRGRYFSDRLSAGCQSSPAAALLLQRLAMKSIAAQPCRLRRSALFDVARKLVALSDS
jgi:hypothetical protein